MEPPTTMATAAPPGGEDEMPQVYIQPEMASATTVPQSSDIFNNEFLCSLDCLLKVIEMVFSLITFICACVDYTPFTQLGGGWVQFVAITAFMFTGVIFLVHMFRMTPKLSDKIPCKFTEFCYYAIYTLFYFIAGIVAACNGYLSGAVVAATVFAFFSLVVFGCDAAFRFMDWRSSSEGPYFSSMMTSSSTT